jgi:hypothetical protein
MQGSLVIYFLVHLIPERRYMGAMHACVHVWSSNTVGNNYHKVGKVRWKRTVSYTHAPYLWYGPTRAPTWNTWDVKYHKVGKVRWKRGSCIHTHHISACTSPANRARFRHGKCKWAPEKVKLVLTTRYKNSSGPRSYLLTSVVFVRSPDFVMERHGNIMYILLQESTTRTPTHWWKREQWIIPWRPAELYLGCIGFESQTRRLVEPARYQKRPLFLRLFRTTEHHTCPWLFSILV